MESFFNQDSGDRLPPDQVRIVELKAEPWPDAQRVRAHVQVTPFAERPNLEITVYCQGEESATVSIIELLHTKLVVTLHLKRIHPEGRYTMVAKLTYPDQPPMHEVEVDFEAPMSTTSIQE